MTMPPGRPSKTHTDKTKFYKCIFSLEKNQHFKIAFRTWFRHITWLHPPSFSIVALHFGHSFVLAWIQLYVSESSSHFFFHNLSKSHWTGSCHFEPQEEQSVSPHSHATSIPTLWSCDWIFMTKLQSGVLQKSIDLKMFRDKLSLSPTYLCWDTKESIIKFLYWLTIICPLGFPGSLNSWIITSSSMNDLHWCAGQVSWLSPKIES